MRTLFASLAVLLCALGAFAAATDGYRALTTEQARRLDVAERALHIPDADLIDARGRAQPLSAMLADDGRIALVDFVYTRCNGICSVLGVEFQQVQRAILAQGLEGRVRLLSVSFDPAQDDPSQLARYAARMHADPAIWTFATVPDSRALRRLLDTFGIVVVPDGRGGFQHNAALHVVTAQGDLVRIFDYSAPDTALDEAKRLASAGRS